MTWRLILGMTVAIYAFPLQAEILNYPHALLKVEEHNRPLKAAEADMQMQMAEAWQAGLLTNPLLSFEVEDFGGSRFFKGFKRAEYTLSLTQPIELGGKRAARQNAALAAVCKSYWSYEALKQRLRRELEEAFIIAAATQEHLEVMGELQRVAQDALAFTTEKAACGKVPLFQQKRASLISRTSQLTYGKTKSDADAALGAIATLTGNPCRSFEAVYYPFYHIEAPLPFYVYEQNLENNPQLAAARMDVHLAYQIHQLEKANRIPDLDVTAGVCAYNDEGDNSFLIELSMPLPIFNQNHGNVCRSSWQTRHADYMQEDLALTLYAQLATAHQRFLQAYEAARSLQDDIQKCAIENLDSAQESYKQGKIEQLELLDAYRTCSEVRDHYIETLKDYHLRRIEVENLAPCGRA